MGHHVKSQGLFRHSQSRSQRPHSHRTSKLLCLYPVLLPPSLTPPQPHLLPQSSYLQTPTFVPRIVVPIPYPTPITPSSTTVTVPPNSYVCTTYCCPHPLPHPNTIFYHSHHISKLLILYPHIVTVTIASSTTTSTPE